MADSQAFLHQPIDDAGDRRSIISNQAGEGHLIDARICIDRRERSVLNGREVEACFLDLRKEHGHRNLLEAAR